jgi:hypothetical protein
VTEEPRQDTIIPSIAAHASTSRSSTRVVHTDAMEGTQNAASVNQEYRLKSHPTPQYSDSKFGKWVLDCMDQKESVNRV